MKNPPQPLTGDQQALFDSHLYLAARIAGRSAKKCGRVSYDEAYSAACQGLWMAAARFRPDAGSKFVAYSYPCIWGAIIDYLRSTNGRYPYQRAINQAITCPMRENVRGESDTRPAFVPAVQDTAAETDEWWEDNLVGLTTREKRMVVMYYRGGHTMQEIASQLGLSESRISQMHAAVLSRIRTRMERTLSV